METDLELAQRAALTGATEALRHFAVIADLPQERKKDGSVVTMADRAVEDTIRAVLTAARPADAILGEEHGETASGGNGRRWIIDPIDGTALFVRGDNRWLVLIALEVDGEVTVGVQVVPAQGLAWWAERGRGAFRARALFNAAAPASPAGPAVPASAVPAAAAALLAPSVPSSASGADPLTPAVSLAPFTPSSVSADSHSSSPGVPPGGWGGVGAAERLVDVERIHVAAARDGVAGSRLGVVPLDWGREVAEPLLGVAAEQPWPVHPPLLVAQGDLDVAVQTSGQIWDFAASSVIIPEAGGVYRGLNGQERPGTGAFVFASSPQLLDESLRLLRGENVDMPV
ncbi:inositol monophosphatase family protein [Actinoplanes awajinensis]|uniref:inositol-phosphate phosphatase n=1 Tax=Actinoplanes awajinensis subsp. mycoplanecinus TaxID=135947 RepID=A0A101JJF5_9ACTN|nr:inositol monophosphatase [Actinoplanes awajinensis]KUL27946.1 histidinol phosphate phosphatase [Actinoplanes awajinensis subsp. mycoplanecinus]